MISNRPSADVSGIIMIPVELLPAHEVARSVAARVRALRLERGWTQQETAARAGIALPTYRAFERTGRISLERLLKIAIVLDASAGFAQLFPLPPARSLDELEARAARGSTRKRGKRRDAKA
jgi:transcriptional regulator with XRE-family HTH domain